MGMLFSVLYSIHSAARNVTCSKVHELESFQNASIFENYLNEIIRTSARNVQQRPFTTSRGKEDMELQFGQFWKDAVNDLKSTDVILEPGAGDFQLALGFQSPQSPQYIGISFELIRRTPEDVTEMAKRNPQQEFIVGHFFEKIPKKRLLSRGPIKLIVDFFGVLSYTARPSQVLRKYLEILDDSGYIMIQGPLLSYQGKDGLVEILKRTEGIEFIVSPSDSLINTSPNIFIRKNGRPLRVPRVKILDVDQGIPPQRKIEILNSFI